MTSPGSGTGLAMPKISYASTLIVEDHLKKLLTSNTAKPFRAFHNKLLPRVKHSAFGDFPADKMPAKRTQTLTPPPIDLHVVSISAKAIPTVKKGEGIGGRSFSLLKPKEKPTP
jgi:hypothetical protein